MINDREWICISIPMQKGKANDRQDSELDKFIIPLGGKMAILLVMLMIRMLLLLPFFK